MAVFLSNATFLYSPLVIYFFWIY